MPGDDWIKVYETDQLHLAVMVQTVLREHHIQSVILNQKDSLYITIGEIGVFVALENASEALIVIDREIS